MRILYFSLICSFFCSTCRPPEPPQYDKLWYTFPATEWAEALPIGNGKIGAMVFGDPVTERIQLNDDSLWPADTSAWGNPEGRPADIDRIRQLLIDGKHHEADDLFVKKFSNQSITRSHQTLGDVIIEWDHDSVRDYRRELDISNAVFRATYSTPGATIEEEAFASAPDDVITIRFKHDGQGGLSGKIKISRPLDMEDTTAISYTKNGNLYLQGEVSQRDGRFFSEPFPLTHGVKFLTTVSAQNKGGSVTAYEDYLELNDVKELTLFIVTNSSFYHEDYYDQTESKISEISAEKYDHLKDRHIADYKTLYDRVKLDLGDHYLDSLDTRRRLQRVQAGAQDQGLEALQFQYGRYLLISSSKPGSNPANLQGLWNDKITAPWNADYHLNINLQMNYWLANLTGLDELNEPLFDFIDRVVENGKTTASENFGCRGSFLPHATDLLGPTWMRAATAYWGCSMGAAGWMMQHYYTHYQFTQDEDFLRNRAYPVMKEVVQFYSDWLMVDPRDNTLVSAPSTSPENRFVAPNGQPAATCMGSAFDQQVIEELFRNYIEACSTLGIEDELLTTVKSQYDQLRPGFVIGDDGRILEWDRPYSEFEKGHRHMSHLYSFYPGYSPQLIDNSELNDAVRKTLDYRLDHGGAGPGWSRAWLINCSARLRDGDMAHEHVHKFFEKSVMTNLFCSHPPFQIDGNFGYTAGITEMLVQSHENGKIRLLPALPEAWTDGAVTGLKARGGLTIDITWHNRKIEYLRILSARNQNLIVTTNDGNERSIELQKGQIYTYNED